MATVDYRERYAAPRSGVGVTYWQGNPDGYYPYSIETGQRTTSRNHHWRELRSSGGDVGGGFETVKYSYSGSDPMVNAYYGGPYRYIGPQFAAKTEMNTSQYPDAGRSSPLTLNSYGATAIARTIPTHPVASASTALGELFRDGIPDMLGVHALRDRAHAAKKAGNEYLNLEFGWKPLIADVMKIAKAARNMNSIIAQLERDSGRVVRRRYTFPSVTSSDSYTLNDGVRKAQPALYGPAYEFGHETGPLTVSTTTSRDRWFSGAYTYLFETGSDISSQLVRYEQEANKLFGIRITPETLWELQPWSWAVDWVSNVGDVFTNVSSFMNDGLVLKYGYIMEHTITSTTYRLDNIRLRLQSTDLPLSQTFTTEWKVRQEATPFGFGLQLSEFTPRQIAIVAALGLTKNGRVAQ